MTTTIVAISSPPGPGRRGILRLSGPRTLALLHASTRTPSSPPTPSARSVHSARFDDGTGTQPALLLWMPGPHSYTREDVAELHLPGSPPLLNAALRRLVELGATLAEPGEFTRRAFESGRLDLFQAEGVLSLVEAASEAERRSAARLLFGGLGERVAALRDELEELRALCEASLDFDESTTPGTCRRRCSTGWRARAVASLEQALTWEERREPGRRSAEPVARGGAQRGQELALQTASPAGRAAGVQYGGHDARRRGRDLVPWAGPTAGSPTRPGSTPPGRSGKP